MSESKNLLVELFVEELPPKALKKLGEAFAEVLASSLVTQGLAEAAAAVTAYASPRRLAVHVANVAVRAADRSVSQKLMPVSVGLTADGAATPALLKRLAALGAGAEVVSALKRQGEGKAESLYFDSIVAGTTIAAGLQIAFDEAIAKLPIPKVMSYQLADGWTSVHFVRPVHALVALHGSEVLPLQGFGLTAGRATHGHRFEAKADPIQLETADSYAAQLRNDGAVIASFAERRAEIATQLAAAAKDAGGTPIDDDALLDEVTALVERPNVLVGEFESTFLDVPQECLILTMKANQKYFPLLDAAGKLTNRFLIVSNIRPADASAVVQGNERVVRPRLADAKFFFDQDRKKTLESRVPGLAKVVYHGKLGTQGERMERVRAIARGIARTWLEAEGELHKGTSLRILELVDRAAMLAKCDLLTDMVGEFPELQGIMGQYYAENDGEDLSVAQAISDHYLPKFSGDRLPGNNLVSSSVALADKLETLVGMFGIGQLPTGDRDPYALRRHALGVIRIVMQDRSGRARTGAPALPLPLSTLLNIARSAFGSLISDPTVLLKDFFRERLAGYLRDKGYGATEVEAVLSVQPDRLGGLASRLDAVRRFRELPEAADLAAANKRVTNILKKAGEMDDSRVDTSLLVERDEIALYEALSVVGPKADAAYNNAQFADSLQALAALKVPVYAFFETVMVNAEDPALRANRLGLLATLHAAMNRVADLSKLAT